MEAAAVEAAVGTITFPAEEAAAEAAEAATITTIRQQAAQLEQRAHCLWWGLSFRALARR